MTTNSRPRYLPPPAATADRPPGARQEPLRIGVELRATTQAQYDESGNFDASIMHHVVQPVLKDVVVSLDASCMQLANTFQVPVAVVASHWLTSRSPMELPGYDERIREEEVKRERRMMMVGEEERRMQREFLRVVGEKLKAYVRDGVVEEEGCLSGRCGFNKLRAHPELDVCGQEVSKGGKGLYRCALTVTGEKWYSEVVVNCLGGEGGLIIGVGGEGHILNRVPGEGGGVGLHASGRIICNGEWKEVGKEVREGDVVGVLVSDGAVCFFVNGEFVGKEAVHGRVALVACLYRRGSSVQLRCCERQWQYYKKEWQVGAVCGQVDTSAMSECSTVAPEQGSKLTP